MLTSTSNATTIPTLVDALMRDPIVSKVGVVGGPVKRWEHRCWGESGAWRDAGHQVSTAAAPARTRTIRE
ncbi:hypothetical protein [Nannocystis radixulma]|uniref:Uncharacterized protein n=1 Tax=Nannocystis radixulma TaxID=2995305 RepID=A0ABT5B9E3_9BACT|nr:hypothetical protein [Nannocystis radixulma]MDC0670756.1 hypothetical protein [Nannocystis radixulma]